MMIVVRKQTYDDGFKETLGDGEPIVWILRPRLPFLLYQLPLWERAIEKEKTTIKLATASLWWWLNANARNDLKVLFALLHFFFQGLQVFQELASTG